MHETLDKNSLYVAADILFLTVKNRHLYLLLSRRTQEPNKGLWALPGCLVNVDESAEEAIRRLTNEMLPGAEGYFEQLYTFTDTDRDARGRVVSIAYLAIVPQAELERIKSMGGMTPFELGMDEHGALLTGADGQQLKADEIAFDHAKIIQTGIVRLRGKIEYTSIGLRFLGDKSRFTMNELEGIFEAVLGAKADKSNFRRFIRNRYTDAGKIVSLGEIEKQGRGRPAVLYDWKEREEEA